MKRRPVVIIHFQPLELYPPAMNFIRYIEKYCEGRQVEIITTFPPDASTLAFSSGSEALHIRRFGSVYAQQIFILRIINYVFFYVAAFCSLLIIRPAKIMYYESLSAFPAYLYQKYINRQSQIFIHYHEYLSKQEYASGMKLVRYFHFKEQAVYRSAQWISHTNAIRLKMFLEDEGLKQDQRFKILPNYPPHSWQRTKTTNPNQYPIKIVYIGALSTETMYVTQFAAWVAKQNGTVKWDIYSSNVSPDAKSFFANFKTDDIQLKKGVSYYSLPEILQQYTAGVILYNGHIPNYVYNAPNKLFEYLCCGLDVWVPAIAVGCQPYYTANTFPKVMPVDFQELDSFDIEKAFDKEGFHYLPSPYCYEQVYGTIADVLFTNS